MAFLPMARLKLLYNPSRYPGFEAGTLWCINLSRPLGITVTALLSRNNERNNYTHSESHSLDWFNLPNTVVTKPPIIHRLGTAHLPL
jgi:hypothetical protein